MMLKEYSIKNLERKYKLEKNIKVRERLQILILLREGNTQRDVSRTLRLSTGIIPFWKKRFEKEGFEGLKDKKGRGIKSQLSSEQLKEIKKEIIKGLTMPDGYKRGYKTKDVKELIKTKFGKEYTIGHCRKILHMIKCTLKVPRPRNKSRSRKAVAKFKEEFKKNEKYWAIK